MSVSEVCPRARTGTMARLALPRIRRRRRTARATMRALAAAASGAPGADLAGATFVVVDVETTGWRPSEAALTEIGAVRLSGGRPAAEFSALVNPGMPIPPRVTGLTGITDDMVRDVPAAGDVLPIFLEFAAGAILTAHNAPFDTAFLADACHRNGLRWSPGPVVDTAVLARIVLRRGEVADRRLATLAAHFGTETAPNHRALEDARATAEVLTRLITLLAERGQAMRYPRAARGLLRASARATLGRLLQPRRALAGTLLGGQPSGTAGTDAGPGGQQAAPEAPRPGSGALQSGSGAGR